MNSQADDTNWAVSACADAALGDLRRTKRLVERAGVLAQHHTAAFITSPWCWLVPDPTEVDWTNHRATQVLGPLGHTACQGRLVDSTLAFTPERVPLGLLAQHVWARAPDDVGKRTRRKQRPISQNDSQTWLTSLEAVSSAHDGCPQTRFVSVGDREADVYDLLVTARPEGVELVIRASWDRAVCAPERSVWATVEAQSVVEPLLPGAETLWRGFQHLTDFTSRYRLLRSAPP